MSGKVLLSVVVIVFAVTGLVYGDLIKTPAERLYEEGITLHREGKTEQAIEKYKAALFKDAEHSPSLYALGLAYHELGDHEKAQDVLDEAVIIRPDNARARALLGEVQLTLGMLEKARANFRIVRSRYPDNVSVLVGLGKAEYFLGNRFAGEDYLKRALKLDPDNEYLKDTVAMTEEANREFLRAEEAEKRRKILMAFNEAVFRAGQAWMAEQARIAAAKAEMQQKLALAEASAPKVEIKNYRPSYPWYPWHPWTPVVPVHPRTLTPNSGVQVNTGGVNVSVSPGRVRVNVK